MLDNVMNQITALLAGRRNVDPANPDFGVRTQQDIVDARSSTTAAFRSLLAWVAAISLVVGGIGIMNIMLVSVTERTREIGLRQALGARPRDVQRQFLLEAVMLSLVGGLAGLIFGVGGSFVFGELAACALNWCHCRCRWPSARPPPSASFSATIPPRKQRSWIQSKLCAGSKHFCDHDWSYLIGLQSRRSPSNLEKL